MSLSCMRSLFLAFCTSLLLVSCGGKGSSASPPASGITATAGNNQVTITWTQEPGVTYWLLYTVGSSVSTDAIPAQHVWVASVTSPYTVTGLTNGVTYAFTVNGRVDGGPGGSGAPSQAATPRPAGVSGSWTADTGLGSSTINALTYDGSSNYLAAGSAGALYSATDGQTWSAISTAPAASFNAAVYANSQFVIAGAAGSIYTSSNLSTWTPSTSNTTNNLNALASSGSVIVAVGDSGTILSSSNGSTWSTAANVPTSNALYGVGYYNGTWYAVGASGTLLSSTDANTWTALNANTTQDLRAVGVTLLSSVTTLYTAVGANGTLVTSTDGSTWTPLTLGSNTFYAVNASSTQVLAVGAAGTAYTSSDGVIWTAQTTGTSANLLCLYGSPSKYFSAGTAGVGLVSQ